jgi:hypothetical protein
MSPKKDTKRKISTPVRLVWGLICRSSAIDQKENTISLFHVVERITIPKEVFPKDEVIKNPSILSTNLELILFWHRIMNPVIDDTEIYTDIKLDLVDPSGRVLHTTVPPFKLPKQLRGTRYKIKLSVLPVTIPGDYCYAVSFRHPQKEEYEKVYEIPLEILIR